MPDIQKTFDAASIDYTMEVHPGTEHGFCFPGRPAYKEDAAEKVWDIVFDLYARKLKA